MLPCPRAGAHERKRAGRKRLRPEGRKGEGSGRRVGLGGPQAPRVGHVVAHQVEAAFRIGHGASLGRPAPGLRCGTLAGPREPPPRGRLTEFARTDPCGMKRTPENEAIDPRGGIAIPQIGKLDTARAIHAPHF